MRRFLIGLGFAIAGLVLAVGLTAGAFAIGGRDLSRPVQPLRVTQENVTEPDESESLHSPRPSASIDDNGGDRPDSDSGSSNSGSGSSNSGSGSSNSGSGSSNSGSGSDDESEDD